MKEVLQKNCGILSDPMGKPDTSQEVPIVHPTIKLSEDHFRRKPDLTDGTYLAHNDQRRAFEYCENVQFDDVVGLVKFQLHIYI